MRKPLPITFSENSNPTQHRLLPPSGWQRLFGAGRDERVVDSEASIASTLGRVHQSGEARRGHPHKSHFAKTPMKTADEEIGSAPNEFA